MFRAQAWASALDDAIPVEVAREIVIDHYRRNTTVLMPAHVNAEWKRIREMRWLSEMTSMHRNEVQERREKSTPMPISVREALKAVGRS